jgi:hypothetical protein
MGAGSRRVTARGHRGIEAVDAQMPAWQPWLAEDAPETTVDIVRKLMRAAQAGVEKGHWPRNEAWLAVLARPLCNGSPTSTSNDDAQTGQRRA